MSKLGIIANPASGKDIRRLVSQATVISTYDKSNIVKRAILGVDSVGVDEVFLMPDFEGLGEKALEDLHYHRLDLKLSFLDMRLEGGQEDSIRAARMLKEARVDCIITLGGDGTNRVVSKSCGKVPLIPISTGTNNVFPIMNEGTTAGIAAGILARKIVNEELVTTIAKKWSILAGGEEKDLALIDAVVVTEAFIGTKALWDVDTMRQILLTRADPGSIGLSAIGSALCPVDVREPVGLLIELGPGGEKVRAPIAPGLIVDVPVNSYRVVESGEKMPVRISPSIIALDGEREVEVYSPEKYELVLSLDGPKVGDIYRILQEATKIGFFRRDGKATKA
jgi:predicted polyphosphate/ATP-dependent NAD kinase